MSDIEKKVVVKPIKKRDSFDIFSREDVIDWEKLDETLKDLSIKDTYKNNFKDNFKDNFKK